MEILRQKTVLIAAAEIPAREAVCEELRGAGCQVLSVTGGIEAYELARERQVDAVLTAGRLTSGSPAQLLADVRRLNHDTPVILFGAAGEALTQTEALHRGFAAFFLQTFPTSLLREATARSLEFVAERKKKKVERVSVAAQAELRFDGNAVAAPVLNLSRGGMFVSLERGFPQLHSVLEFKLTMAQGPQPDLEGRALVRWVRDRQGSGHLPGVGLEFTEISPTVRAFFEAYVDRSGRR